MHILTVDVEDWFHILDHASTETEDNWRRFPSRLEEGVNRLLGIFDRYDYKATFFVLGWVARNFPDIVLEIAHHGHEIASHSDMHQLVYKQSPAEFEYDLLQSLEVISKASGKTPKAYRAPGFSITPDCRWAFDILAQNGIELDCSIFPANRAHGGFPGFPTSGPCRIITNKGLELVCFPINLKRIWGRKFVFSGGGYFRLTPEPLLRHWFKIHPYIMTYFHPRDFDPDQPIVPDLSLIRKFKAYTGLGKSFRKLDKLLSENSFINLAQAMEQINQSELPVVYL